MPKLHFRLESPAFQEGRFVPPRHTCDGENVSPRLDWNDPPPETRSFVLIVDDPDAPAGLFTHWVLFDVPEHERALPEGARGIGRNGRNDFQGVGYGGPCPPPNDADHRYFFKLHALDVATLDLPEGATRARVEEAMAGHVLAEGRLMGRYRRRTGD